MKLIMENFRKFINEARPADEELAWKQRYRQKWKEYERSGLSKKEEAEWYGSGIAQLIENPNLIKDDNWMNQKFNLIGAGSYRKVYEIKEAPGFVLKAAKFDDDEYTRKEASYSNAKEKAFFNKYPEFMPKVYLSSDTVQKKSVDDQRGGLQEFVDWLIVEEVKVPDLDEYKNLVMTVFPSVKKIVDHANQIQIVQSTTGEPYDPAWVLRQFMDVYDARPAARKRRDSQLKYVIDEFERNWISSQQSRHISLGKANKYAKWALDTLRNDRKLKKFMRMTAELGVATWDIRAENIGTRTGKEFMLIDISIFAPPLTL